MDAILSVLSVAAVLSLFGVIAAVLGADTREGFADDFRSTPRFR